jgi:hypothetical protein
MESGAVYAFKDRLMKNTEFFEEVKISGVSYLVPRALRFVDVTGTYTDLVLNFDEGTVVLPTRRKTAPLPDSPVPTEESRPITSRVVEAIDEVPPIAQDKADDKAEDKVAEAKPPSYPPHTPEIFEEISPASDASDAAYPSDVAAKVVVAAPSPTRVPETPPTTKKKMAMPPKTVTLFGAAILLALLAVLFMYGPTLVEEPVPPTFLVKYSANLTNSSNESYLGLNITNPEGMANDMEIALPPNIDQSISARGGIVTISHGDNTLVRMNSTGDASVKIYLQGNWTTIPVGLSFYAPDDFDTNLLVHGLSSTVTSRNETSILMFNLTREGVSFEQSYTRKK